MEGIYFDLENVLNKYGISKNALAREAKIRPNTIYEICANTTKRIEIKTFNEIMKTLGKLSNNTVRISDIIKYDYGTPYVITKEDRKDVDK